MPEQSKKRKNRPDLIVFSAFAFAGLIFALGLEVVSSGDDDSICALLIHLATPTVFAGLVGLLISPRIWKNPKMTSAFGYTLFAVTGVGAALLIVGFFENDQSFEITLKSYYLACWFGLFCGLALCFAIDETRKDKK